MKVEFDVIKIIKDIKKLQQVQSDHFHNNINYKGDRLHIDHSSDDEHTLNWSTLKNSVTKKFPTRNA